MFYVQLIVTILGVSTIFALIATVILLGIQSLIKNFTKTSVDYPAYEAITSEDIGVS